VWKGLQQAKQQGLARAIGVSNFAVAHPVRFWSLVATPRGRACMAVESPSDSLVANASP
jgi:aryl-alcohol dehydrogenase-like predicted oxidoreductase